jgi:hypothetical protein
VTARGQINGPSGGVAEAVFEGLCQERPGTNWMWVSAPPMPINSALPVAPIQNADGPSWNGKRGQYQFDRTGRPSITKTERPRSASLLQMPRGLTCNLRQREREYGGPAGSLGIDPPLQPSPLRSSCWGRPSWTGGIPATRFGGLFCILQWPISASTPKGSAPGRTFSPVRCLKINGPSRTERGPVPKDSRGMPGPSS